MINFLQPGDTISLVAPYTVASGAGALVGSIFGVATGAVTSGASGQFMIEGVFSLAKTSAQAWSQGDDIYWDDANKRCDTDATKGPLIGTATVAAANPSSVGSVRLTERLSRARGVTSGTPAPTSKNTSGAVTLTAAEVLTGILVADPAGADRTYTFPTAALLVAAVPGAKVGDMVSLRVINGGSANSIILAAGSGGAFDANQLSASRLVGTLTSKTVSIRLTNVTAASEAYVMYA